MRRKIYGYFLLFVLFAVALLWFFQIVFLGRFYTVITKNRLADAALLIAELDDPDRADRRKDLA